MAGTSHRRLLARLPLSFVRIARRNLELCLPERSPAEDASALLREHFRSVGVGIFETAISWWSSDERIVKLTRLEGEEHLRGRARARPRRHPAQRALHDARDRRARDLRPHADEHHVSTDQQSRARTLPHAQPRQQAKRAIPRDDVRTLITALKNNEPVWYAPDQSYRKKGAEMVPFFSIPAATNTATSRLARMTGAAVLPYFPERLPGSQGYRMVIHPMLDRLSDEGSPRPMRAASTS